MKLESMATKSRDVTLLQATGDQGVNRPTFNYSVAKPCGVRCSDSELNGQPVGVVHFAVVLVCCRLPSEKLEP